MGIKYLDRCQTTTNPIISKAIDLLIEEPNYNMLLLVIHSSPKREKARS